MFLAGILRLIYKYYCHFKINRFSQFLTAEVKTQRYDLRVFKTTPMLETKNEVMAHLHKALYICNNPRMDE